MAEKALLDTGATGIAIALKEDASFVCRATAGTTVPTLGVHIDEAVGLTGACIRSRKTEICADAAFDQRVNAEACEQLQIASIIVVPILDAGQTVGIVEALSSTPYAFDSEAILVLEKVSDQSGAMNSEDSAWRAKHHFRNKRLSVSLFHGAD